MFCKFDTVLCDQLPQECSSYIFTGLFVSLSYNVEDRFGAENDGKLKTKTDYIKLYLIVYNNYNYELSYV